MSAGNEREFIDYLQRKEGKTMKCPRKKHLVMNNDNSWDDLFGECLKEECAYWNKGLKTCDPTGLLPRIDRLIWVIEELVKKMPHELQFRK